VQLDSTQRPWTVSSSLAESLLRPFVDLEPCETGPLFARGLDKYWTSFAEGGRSRFVLQRVLPRTFRNAFLCEAGRPEFIAQDPREVPKALRSPRWNALCDALDGWPELSTDRQCRLALVLQALCFYSLISTRIGDISESELSDDADRAELAYRRASANYMLGLPERVSAYSHADLSDLERIGAKAPRNQSVTLKAALEVLVHKAKVGVLVEQLDEWRTRSEWILEALLPECDDFTRELLLSRYYRAAAFVPQRRGDRKEVVRMLGLAEHHALAMVAENEAQELLFLENLIPVLESRTKEALWLGDLDLALARAQRVVDLDPYDSKAWLELGQVRLKRNEYAPGAEAYALAATLGPPASAIGRHMAGLCFRELGQPLLAAFFFKAALDIDPRGISPHDEIQRLPDVPALAALKEWSLYSFEA
jgi:tetratricopeptide (TPR) repeat protein